MLGVTIQSVDADLATSLNLPAARGAIVTSVARVVRLNEPDIKRGDVITAINKQPVADNNNLRNLVASMAPGSNVEVTAVRNGRDQNFQVALAELPTGRDRKVKRAAATSGGAETRSLV